MQKSFMCVDAHARPGAFVNYTDSHTYNIRIHKCIQNKNSTYSYTLVIFYVYFQNLVFSSYRNVFRTPIYVHLQSAGDTGINILSFRVVRFLIVFI